MNKRTIQKHIKETTALIKGIFFKVPLERNRTALVWASWETDDEASIVSTTVLKGKITVDKLIELALGNTEGSEVTEQDEEKIKRSKPWTDFNNRIKAECDWANNNFGNDEWHDEVLWPATLIAERQ